MERFVKLIVVGGVVLVAACWLVALSEWGSSPWLVGIALVLVGLGGLTAGIFSELEVSPF